MEIEAKFRATQRIRPHEIEKIDFTPFAVGRRVRHTLYDTLLDTSEHVLRRNRYVMRIRQTDGHEILTVKGPAEVRGATHTRAELEVRLGEGETLAGQAWAREMATHVRTLIGAARLKPMFTIHNRRRTWDVLLNGVVVAELALDRGKITAGYGTTALHEVEVELKGNGTEVHLDQIARRLRSQLPLESEPQSKAARGWALYARTSGAALVTARDRVPLTRIALLAEAGRSVLAGHLLKLFENLPIAEEGTEPEGVHQARVAIRRMRAVMAELSATVYKPRKIAPLRRGLRGLAGTLGAVRDADVFLLALDEYVVGKDGTERVGLEPLYRYVRHQREAGRKAFLKTLRSRDHARLMDQLVTFVTTPGAAVDVRLDAAGVPQIYVQDFVQRILLERYQAVAAYAPGLATAPIAILHELRIEVKRLRYVLDLFSDALAKSQAKLLKEPLVEAQEHLGNLNDTDVALTLLATVAHDDPLTAALERYRATIAARQQELYLQTPDVLAPLMAEDYLQAIEQI